MTNFTDASDPIELLEELAAPFAHAAEHGEEMTLDPVLCRAFADALNTALGAVRALADLAEAEGLLQRVNAAAKQPRTPVERRLLAAMAAPLDPDGRVLAFPLVITRHVAVSEGGSAA